jgi:hypothetical protein
VGGQPEFRETPANLDRDPQIVDGVLAAMGVDVDGQPPGRILWGSRMKADDVNR